LESVSFVMPYGANAQQQYFEDKQEEDYLLQEHEREESIELYDQEEYYAELLQKHEQVLIEEIRSGRRLQEWGDEGGGSEPTASPPIPESNSNSSGNTTSGGEAPSKDYLTVWYTDRTAASIHIDWSISEDWAGSLELISSFIVEVNSTTRGPITVASTLRSVKVTELKSLTIYALQLKAIAMNSSVLLESKTLTVSTFDTSAPNSPRAVNVKSVGGGYIEVEVLPSYFTGGVDLVSTTVRAQSVWDSTMIFKTQNSTNTTIRIYGLRASTTYYVTAFVTNAKGFSSPNTALPYVQTSALQPPGKPPPPIVLDVTGL
jgi:hypothetical protein